MKTILAHLKKDIASFRPLLWIWVICVSIDCLLFLPGGTPHRQTVIPHGLIGGFNLVLVAGFVVVVGSAFILFCVQMLLFPLLIIQVIHADPLTESDAFWRTRPISRSALLTEKALFVVLLLIGTILAMLAVKFHFQNTSKAATMLQAVVFATGLMAFATVTSNFSKLILTVIAIAFGAGALASIFLGLWRFGISMSNGLFHFPLNEQPLFINNIGQFGISVLYISGFLSVIVCQYLTLKTNISRLLLFATVFLAMLLEIRY
jgi:hypothetical protein